MVCSSEIQCWKIFYTIQFGEDVFDFRYGPDELLSDFVQGSIIDDKAFPPLPLGTTMMGDDQLEWLLHITFTSKNLLFASLT